MNWIVWIFQSFQHFSLSVMAIALVYGYIKLCKLSLDKGWDKRACLVIYGGGMLVTCLIIYGLGLNG